MRRLLAILLPGLLLLTACGGGQPAAPEPTSQSAGETAKLDSLKLTENGDKKAPGVEFTKPLEVKELTTKVVTEGSGDRLKANQLAELSVAGFNGADGKSLGDNFSKDPEELELNDALKSGNAPLYNVLVGAKVGSHVALAVPGQPAAQGSEAQPSQLLIIKVLSAKDAPKVLDKPEGDAVTPPAGLPTVKENDKGVPEITVEGVAAPKALVSQDLIKGKGQAVKESDTITANYVLYSLKDKKKLEASFDSGKPLVKKLSQLIPGWQQGLAGKTVGSRVLLVVPAKLAYGAAQGDLVFVVDILGAR